MKSPENESNVLDGGTTLAPNIDWLRKQEIARVDKELLEILLKNADKLGLLTTTTTNE